MISTFQNWKRAANSAVFSAILLFISANFVHAQTSTEPNQSPFRHEIGVDFNYFLENKSGLNFIFKYQIAPPTTEKWAKTWAVRLVPGFFKQKIGVDISTPKVDSLQTYVSMIDKKAWKISIGAERQFTRNRFRFWLGGNFGFARTESKSDSHRKLIFNGMTVNEYKSTGEIKSNTPSVAVFSGCQFFILPRLSIGIELDLPLEWEFSKTTVVPEGGLPFSDSGRVIDFGGNGKFPNLLFISFIF